MKNLKNLGKILNKKDQKSIFGGARGLGISDGECKDEGKICSETSDCDLDATCNYSRGRCFCNDENFGGLG